MLSTSLGMGTRCEPGRFALRSFRLLSGSGGIAKMRRGIVWMASMAVCGLMTGRSRKRRLKVGAPA